MNNLPGHNKELMNHLTAFQPNQLRKRRPDEISSKCLEIHKGEKNR